MKMRLIDVPPDGKPHIASSQPPSIPNDEGMPPAQPNHQ